MTLLELLTSPWAILPDKLQEIQAIYATHLRGDKIDIPTVEARLGRPLASEQQDYLLREGGVAVLTLDGAIAPKANLFMQISGGVSSQIALKQVQSMHADPRVRAAVIEIDSPGGSVFGVPAVADAIHALGQDKPVVAISTGMMASAAYWWGSAANAVYISGLTDFVGSIGVVATHDYQPRAGLQRTEVTAGRYKRIASANEPLSAEGRAYLQAQVDELYRVFVDAVAQHRGANAQQVLQHMADGRTFVGQQAIDAGLVDGVSSLDALVEQLATSPTQFAHRRKAVFAPGAAAPAAPASAAAGAAAAGASTPDEPVPPVTTLPPSTKGPVMPQADTQAPAAITTAQALEAAYPMLAAQIRDQATAAGAQAERDRIQAVRAQALPGHEALVERLAMDGKTTGPEAAMAILAAERQVAAAAAAAHFADAPPAAPASPNAGDRPADTKPPKKLPSLTAAYAALNKRAA